MKTQRSLTALYHILLATFLAVLCSGSISAQIVRLDSTHTYINNQSFPIADQRTYHNADSFAFNCFKKILRSPYRMYSEMEGRYEIQYPGLGIELTSTDKDVFVEKDRYISAIRIIRVSDRNTLVVGTFTVTPTTTRQDIMNSMLMKYKSERNAGLNGLFFDYYGRLLYLEFENDTPLARLHSYYVRF